MSRHKLAVVVKGQTNMSRVLEKAKTPSQKSEKIKEKYNIASGSSSIMKLSASRCFRQLEISER
jgi:hypothetical protein